MDHLKQKYIIRDTDRFGKTQDFDRTLEKHIQLHFEDSDNCASLSYYDSLEQFLKAEGVEKSIDLIGHDAILNCITDIQDAAISGEKFYVLYNGNEEYAAGNYTDELLREIRWLLRARDLKLIYK